MIGFLWKTAALISCVIIVWQIVWALGKDGCVKSWRHKWQYGTNWINQLGLVSEYTGDVLARRGARCYHCGKFRWDHTDEQYREINKGAVTRQQFENLREWDKLKHPERYLPDWA